MAVNSITIVGNLTRNPEMKQVGDTYKTTFTVACEEKWEGKSGVQTRCEYVLVEVWRKLAEVVSRLEKGQKVAVFGSLRSDSYEDKDKIQRKVWFIAGRQVEFMHGRGGSRA